LEEAPVPKEEGIAVAMASYEIDSILFSFPNYQWRAFDAYGGFEERGTSASGSISWILLHERIGIDFPGQLDIVANSNQISPLEELNPHITKERLMLWEME